MAGSDYGGIYWLNGKLMGDLSGAMRLGTGPVQVWGIKCRVGLQLGDKILDYSPPSLVDKAYNADMDGDLGSLTTGLITYENHIVAVKYSITEHWHGNFMALLTPERDLWLGAYGTDWFNLAAGSEDKTRAVYKALQKWMARVNATCAKLVLI